VSADTAERSRAAAEKTPTRRAIGTIAMPIALGALAILMAARIIWQTHASPLPD